MLDYQEYWHQKYHHLYIYSSAGIWTSNILTKYFSDAMSFVLCVQYLQAVDARDALAKKLYSMLFDWLIAAINISLQSAQVKYKYASTIITSDLTCFFYIL
jgi:hypothetical protein